MNDELRPPVPSPEDDLQLDRRLEALPRFRPLTGFAERILARVWVPLPRWARSMRDRFRRLTSGPRGWVVLGSFSAATAATWAVVIGVTVSQWDRLLIAVRALQPVGLLGWRDVWAAALTWMTAAGTGAARALEAVPVPVGALAGGYAILTLVCLVALRRLVTPAGTRAGR